MKNVDVDVVVVGGGISGLYAARCLKAEGLKVVLLEARNHVGGRSITQRGQTEGEYADMGGAYFGIHQTRIAQLAEELGLTMYTLPADGKTTLRFKGKTRFFTGDIPATYNVLELMDLGNVIRVLDTLSLQIDLDEPWSSPKAEKFDSMSIVDFLDSVCWTTFAKTLMYIGFRAVFEVRAERISFLYALHLIRSCGGAKALFSSQKDGLQAMKVVGGCSLISERMAAELGECVLLGQQVTEINQSTSDVEVVTQNGSVFKTKAVVVAASPSVLKFVKWTPSLPDVQQKYMNLKFEKHSFKTVMYYPEAHWAAEGLKGDLLSDSGIVQVAFPDTKYDGSYPAIMGFVEDYEQLTTEQRKEAIANHYADVFGIEAMRQPTDYIEKNWDEESELLFSGPCVFSLPPNFLCKQRQFWGQPFGRVFFAGSESSVVFRGYMEGAVRSAGKAAFDVLKVLNKSPVQSHLASCRDPVEGVPYSELTFVERWVPGVTQLLYGVAVAVVPCLAVFVARFF